MDGLQAAETFQHECPTPIVFVTAFSDRDTVQKACLVEPYGYLMKPFTDGSVSAAVELAPSRARSD